ncbi:MAG TPA: sulfatase-like hydrolase/transferase [Thermoleophilaceae bacterium]|nr:sulfatase-like hydrolase/transferase [Thermoleophilaceae bacterium]
MRRHGLLVAVLSLLGCLAAAGLAQAAQEAGEKQGGARAARPPVVILILDEFQLDTLLRPDGSIDAARYPSFARLAATSTWYPNTTTVFDSTFQAVPAILDAKNPQKGTPADRRAHPVSIDQLFARHGYGVVDSEPGSALCPPSICPGARSRRPSVLARLAGGGRPARLARWIHSIRPRARPTLYLQHALLPHEPWIYLPSGKQSRPPGNDPIEGINREEGFQDPQLTRHNEQRHLLQVGFVDHQVGKLLDRLASTRLLDRALLVVTADHGYSFEVGVRDRRKVTPSNIHAIAPVPMFVKLPGQRRRRVDPRYARNLDLVPTVADVLNMRIPWRHDGRSFVAGRPRAQRSISMPTRDFRRVVSIGTAELARRRRATRLTRARLFGTGFESALLTGSPWGTLYRIGPHPELLGRTVGELRIRRSSTPRVRVANAGLLAGVRRRARLVPTRVTGAIEPGSPGRRRALAVALNGRVAAVGRSFSLRGRAKEYFSFMVPEDSLRVGANRLELFEVERGGVLRRLPQRIL